MQERPLLDDGGVNVTFFVPCYNEEGNVVNTLNTIMAAVAQVPHTYEILVVDDASTDGSAGLAERDYPNVRLVRREKNGGFAAAVNTGIGAAEGELVVVLNNDTRVEPDFISELCRGLSEEPAASMAAPSPEAS